MLYNAIGILSGVIILSSLCVVYNFISYLILSKNEVFEWFGWLWWFKLYGVIKNG